MKKRKKGTEGIGTETKVRKGPISIPEDIYNRMDREIGSIFGLADACRSIDANIGFDGMNENARDCLFNDLFNHAYDLYRLFHDNFTDIDLDLDIEASIREMGENKTKTSKKS